MNGSISLLRIDWSMYKTMSMPGNPSHYVWYWHRKVIPTSDGPVVSYSIGPLRVTFYTFKYWDAREEFLRERCSPGHSKATYNLP